MLLVGLLGGSSVLARIGFGGAVRRFGSVRLYRSCFVLLALGFAVWFVAGSSYGALVVVAIVFGSGYVPIRDMVRAGIWFNLIGVALVTLAFWLLAGPVMGIDFSIRPEWAKF